MIQVYGRMPLLSIQQPLLWRTFLLRAREPAFGALNECVLNKKADFGRDEPKSADAVFDLCGEDDPKNIRGVF